MCVCKDREKGRGGERTCSSQSPLTQIIKIYPLE